MSKAGAEAKAPIDRSGANEAGNLPAIDFSAIDDIIEAVGSSRENIVPLLRAVQEEYGYLPEEALELLAEKTGIRPSEITGAATFYAAFRSRPAGKFAVQVCIGTACHVKGAPAVFDSFRKHLNIPEDDDTDPERLFTVQEVACLGCCMLAPAVRIEDVTYGFVTPETTADVLRDFLASRKTASSSEKENVRPAGRDLAGEVSLCRCTSCSAAGADKVYAAFQEAVSANALDVRIRDAACTGISWLAPVVDVAVFDESGRAEHFRYANLKPRDAAATLLSHFSPPSLTARLKARASMLLAELYDERPATAAPIRFSAKVRDESAYSGRQVRIATLGAGELEPNDLEGYKKLGGFSAWKKCRSGEFSPKNVIKELIASGLRGRGGAGFPTGKKWSFVQTAAGETKYLIVNGDEGDPGAFMDRLLLESFPFRVIEGALIAAWTVGAAEIIFYVRTEYPLALSRLRLALEVCRREKLMGANGLPSARVVEGAGAFVCGEETALIGAIEGGRGAPRYRPPFPARKGLHGRPTLINNVETLSLVPWILLRGAKEFSASGTESSTGTKTFALAGKVNRGGLIEVPMGITLREIVEEIGGGIEGDRKLKAVQVGGPSGGCVPASLADTPVDYESLQSAGAIMGSGGMVVLDDSDCMVDVARYFLAFTQRESCGKCTFCRVGTRRMLEILDRLCEGKGKAGDIELLEELGEQVKAGSLCGLGKTAPNPALSTIRHFRDEYEAHIAGRCPAGKCKALITYFITDACTGCGLCARGCPSDAISGHLYREHEINVEKCVRCGACLSVCPEGAVKVR